MKLEFLAIACLAFVSVATALNEWVSYKSRYGKVYESKQEDALRMDLYLQRKKFIERHNEQNLASFKVGINRLSDWTELELKRLNGFKAPVKKAPNSQQAKRFLSILFGNNVGPVPVELDWRNVPGRVLRVKDQEVCISSWAFATTGLLEGQEMIRKNLTADSVVALSEQNLVDCLETNGGCEGGNIRDALDFIYREGGINDEKSYPYEGDDKDCRFKKEKVVITDKGGAYLPEGDESALMFAVAKYGPIAVAVDASGDSFHTYSSGYGTDTTEGDYWIAKNSWSDDYGEKGYIKMARNKNNNCGIATAATIAYF